MKPNTPFATTLIKTAPVTLSLIVLTTAMWLLQLIPGLGIQNALAYTPMLTWSEPWRALTAALVHAQPSPMHLFANMLGLVFFGSFVERSGGSLFMAITYVLSALGGSVLTLVLTLAGIAPYSAFYVGASGAVFGIVGTLLAPTKRLDRNLGAIVVFLVLNAVVLFFEPNIAWEAHLGGLLVGVLLGCARFLPRPGVELPAELNESNSNVPNLSGGTASAYDTAQLRKDIAAATTAGTTQVTVHVESPAGVRAVPVAVSEARARRLFLLTAAVVAVTELLLLFGPVLFSS